MVNESLDSSLSSLVESQTLQWVFVGGKGGVGKTTTSSSLAVSLAQKKESVLLVSTDPAHNISDAFDQKFSKDPTKVRGMENLSAMEVEVSADGSMRMLEASVGQSFGEAAGPSLFPALDELIKMVPGIDEAIAFGLLVETIRSMNYSTIVFDTAPTGHTLRLLGFPNLFEKAIPKIEELNNRFGGMLGTLGSVSGMTQGSEPMNVTLGRMLKDLQDTVKQVTDQFQDPAKTTFVCVCIPEFLSVYETERLVQELSSFKIDVKNIVINQVIDLSKGIPAEALFAARSNIQMKYLKQIDELYAEDFHVVKVPILAEEIRGKDMIVEYSKMIMGENQKSFGLSSTSEYAGSLANLIEQRTLRWIFCGGKGGVGKTTTSCALATALAEDRAQNNLGPVLIISTDPAHNLSDAFKQRISPGGDPTKIEGFENLYAMEIEPQTAAESVLPREMLKDVAKFIPGVDELVSFSQIAKLVKSMEFSAVVFDTAPTGHTLKLLNFPKLFEKVLEQLGALKDRIDPLLQSLGPGLADSAGNPDLFTAANQNIDDLKQVVAEVGEQMRDSDRTTFVCVAIAEFLSVYETERLVQELFTLEIDSRNIVVNQLLDPEETDKLSLLKARAAMQQKYVTQIEDLYPRSEFHICKVPVRGEEIRGLDLLKSFAAGLTGGQ
ncbi:hypothetical protein NDN08_001569 [Rhodosorus marinus]|uniref:ATPase ASNA1 homolog n=1 Tax=Rhodosorus marinus TaxID=101924 RepID=A0AAV8UUX8_9RHOD|nr:hypothetical protein NDN08_001569 [Rhodosorus marinus]